MGTKLGRSPTARSPIPCAPEQLAAHDNAAESPTELGDAPQLCYARSSRPTLCSGLDSRTSRFLQQRVSDRFELRSFVTGE